MAVQQTECYRVVTIGYLKSFIEQSGSSSLIKDSSNESTSKLITRTDDTYCPTYSELTGGSIVQTWSQGGTPKDDRDGIYVNPSAILGEGYRGDQCVDQKDLGLRYTRFGTLSIGRSGSGNISECGGSATLTYTYNYNRYNKYMNDSCATASTSSPVDSVCSQLAYHTTYGSVSNCTAYSIGKNGTVSASSRDDSIYADVTVRGTYHKSNTITITQNALTGSYSESSSTRTAYTGITAYGVGTTTVDCNGGTCSANATAYYDTYTTYRWKDSCGAEYADRTQERQTGTGGSTTVGQQSYTFSKIDCPTETCSASHTFTFSYGGQSTTYTVNQSGTQSCGAPEPTEKYWPWYPDTSLPANQQFPRGIRGTDNGACYAMCKDMRPGSGGTVEEKYYVAPYLPSSNLPEENEDAILVDTIYVYVNGVRTNLRNTSGRITVTPDVDIEYLNPTGSFGKGEFKFYIKTTNTTDDFKSLVVNFSTDDTEFPSFPGTGYAPYAGVPVAHDWEFIIWQPPANCTVVQTYPETGSISHSGWAHCG